MSERAPSRTEATLAELADRLRRFRDARDWGQFHSPRNLASALSVEAAEVLEHFIWDEEGEQIEVAEELADVAIFLLYLADVLDIDLAQSIIAKVEENETRFPVEAVRGRARPPASDSY